ncbi:MAG: outer membrane protein assembly factor [Chloroflexota bacterium]
MKYPKIYRVILYISFYCLFCPVNAFTQPGEQGQENYISKNLIRGWRDKNQFEIGRIEFEGNKAFPDLVLEGAVASRATSRTFWHKIILAYYNEFKKDEFWPNRIDTALWKALGTMREDIGYFSQAVADADLRSLWDFYNTHGFHFVQIHYNFRSDSASHSNVLTFHVNEGARYTIDTIAYVFKDSIIPSAHERIEKLKFLDRGENFDETNIQLEAENIKEELRNSGYFFAAYQKPIVILDTLYKRDSIVVIVTPGKRQKIGKITFIDSTMGQSKIIQKVKEKQLDFKTGEWYSRKRVQTSRENYLTLGVFDIVNIDTVHGAAPNDTVLDYRVFTQYRKQQEAGLGIFGNQTPMDNFYNAGVELSYMHKNIFNAVQTINPYISFSIKDLKRLTEGRPLEWEYAIGLRYSQPILWTISNTRIGLNTGPFYSLRTFNNYFKIETWALPVKFPVNLPRRTFFRNWSLDLTLERQNPIDYPAALNRALASAKSALDTVRVNEAIALYNNLFEYTHTDSVHINKDHWATANLIGASVTGDNRNHPFSPTEGYYFYGAVETQNRLFSSIKKFAGLARYLRLQAAAYGFWKVSETLTLAVKGRGGHIFQFESENGYVPVDRQFFAGGASSVRGWNSRELRYSSLTADSLGGRNSYSFLQNFIGSRTLIESSLELRYRFNRPAGWNDLVASQIANLGITGFIDAGNAFNWLVGGEQIHLKFGDYFTKLAYAAGFGFRYETPVGPARVDFAWPIHDPRGMRKPSSMVFHLGLGHAF